MADEHVVAEGIKLDGDDLTVGQLTQDEQGMTLRVETRRLPSGYLSQDETTGQVRGSNGYAPHITKERHKQELIRANMPAPAEAAKALGRTPKAYRDELRATVSPQEFAKATLSILAAALDGNVNAWRALAPYLLGDPKDAMKDDQGNAPVLQMMQELMRKSGGGSKKGSPKGIKPRRTVIVEQPAKMKAVQPNLHVREQVDYRDRHLTTHSRTPDPLPKEEQEDEDDFTG